MHPAGCIFCDSSVGEILEGTQANRVALGMQMVLFGESALPISYLLAFLYFMIDDLHIAKRTEDIGYYAGAIVSIFMVGRVLSSVGWAMCADKYGRRPVFALGLLSIAVFQPIFGMSKNYWVAFCARFLLGASNGILGPIKAYASEICSPESQAYGLNVVSTTWSLGLIIGPAIGGFLARPAINFPGIFSENSIFASYPYLLPALVQAFFALFELGVVYYLPETIHKHDGSPADIEQTLVDNEKSHKSSLWLNWPLMASVAVYCIWSLYDISFSEIFSMWCVSPLETGGLNLRTSDVGTILAVSGFGMLCVQLALFPPLANYLGPILVTRAPAVRRSLRTIFCLQSPAHYSCVSRSCHENPKVIVLMLLWAFYQQILAIPLVLLFPLLSYLHGSYVQWLSINVLALLRNSLSAMVVTGSFLLVNNAVPAHQRGAANGISLSCVSVFRAIGPAAGGAIFAWAQSRHDAVFLPGSQVVFVILDVICILAVFTMVPPFLPKQVNEPYSEAHDQESHHVNEEQNVPLLR
jgi:MFS family permease